MTNQPDLYSYRESVRRFLFLNTTKQVEVHLANGHVVVGTITNDLWEARGEYLIAIEVKCPLPDGGAYTRVIMMDHVIEVRPNEEN